jgi:hypothetical protein
MTRILLSALPHWKVKAHDGEVGSIADVLFDDRAWGARYLVIEAGGWLDSRRVLLSPASVRRPAGEIGLLTADITREQVRSAPGIDTDQPVSRHMEAAHALHYGYSPDWANGTMWSAGVYPGVVPVVPADIAKEVTGDPAEDERRALAHEKAAAQTHLRSGNEIAGYRLEATDGDAGDIDDLVIDIETWAIAGLVVDTRRWWPGGRVVLPPSAVTGIVWKDRVVRAGVSLEQVKAAPKPG